MDQSVDRTSLESWAAAQTRELDYWKAAWPLRELPLPAMQERRFADAAWLLGALGFGVPRGRSFEGFTGRVLEVGSGPIGFFDLVEGITCDAIDTLMAAYAWELPYAALEARGATVYLDRPIEACEPTYDFVVCSNVLAHSLGWRPFLGACAAALRPGGRLLLYTTCPAALADGGRPFTPGEVVDAVLQVGLAVVEQARVATPPARPVELWLRARAPG